MAFASPPTGPFGVMDGPDPGATQGLAKVSIVDIHGHVVASAQHALRTDITIQGLFSPQLPYISESATQVYFLDGDSTVRSIDLAGNVRTIGTVPGTPTAHAAFAVSPDDMKMAVSVTDYSTDPPTLHLLVEDLAGTNVREIFSSRSLFVWPVGWHAGRLVVGSGPAFWNKPGFNLSGPVAEYHVVDPQTADRLTTLGSINRCVIISSLSRSGAACNWFLTSCPGCLHAVDWNGKLTRFTAPAPSVDRHTAALSPSGGQIVTVQSPEGVLIISSPGLGGTSQSIPGDHSPLIIGWFDDAHIVITFGAQAEIVEVARVNVGEVIQAPGRYVGPFPNDLG
ncbi:MAG: hypothetical protein M3R21_01340 [Candidatus Dormibacteraeota bacterium]|nr:hypothetical protein [Candidatus Dormibacteraeota bacterium]